jgi:hypothetical protein
MYGDDETKAVGVEASDSEVPPVGGAAAEKGEPAVGKETVGLEMRESGGGLHAGGGRTDGESWRGC